jgi:hypothetical protein
MLPANDSGYRRGLPLGQIGGRRRACRRFVDNGFHHVIGACVCVTITGTTTSYQSYYQDVPPGATIVLPTIAAFVL